MALVALTFGVAMVVLGAVGIVAPVALLGVSRPFLTPAGLYAAAGLRLVLGTVLFLAAPTSRAPKPLRILGVVVIVAGVLTPLLGVDRARAIVDWWAAQGTGLMRVWAVVAASLGVFLVYATAPHAPRPRKVSP
jgi:hypothetical protein